MWLIASLGGNAISLAASAVTRRPVLTKYYYVKTLNFASTLLNRGLVRHAGGVVGRPLDDAVAKPDLRRSLRCGSRENFRLRRMRISFQEVVRDLPRAGAFHLPLTSRGAHDMTVHLLAATPNRSYPEMHGFGLDRYILRPMPIREGKAYASDGPGHGVAFDWEARAKTRIA